MGVSDPRQLVGDYANPILKPQAAELVKKHGEMELSGVGSPTPTNQCWPEPVPYIFWRVAMRMLQQPDKIIMLYGDQVRHVRMNEPHPARATPSLYGDSVGRYEGDMLVVDAGPLLSFPAYPAALSGVIDIANVMARERCQSLLPGDGMEVEGASQNAALVH
jgi:hypothetical protein